MAAALPGFRRLPGLSRRYANERTGAEISYRQYRKLIELSEHYRPLELPELARRRRSQAAFNDLVAARQKALQGEALQRLDTRNMGLIEQAKAEREAMRSVKRSEIVKDPQFKADRATVKALGHRKPSKLTPDERQRMKASLSRLGLREGIPKEVAYGDSELYRKGLMRITSTGRAVAVKGGRAKLTHRGRAR